MSKLSSGIRDTRLLEKALRNRWPMSEEDREDTVRRVVNIVKDQNASYRNVVSAAKCLVSMDQINQREEQGPEILGINTGGVHINVAAPENGRITADEGD